MTAVSVTLHTRESGYSLIELMIAAVIGTLLFTKIFATYFQVHEHLERQQAIVLLNEDARQAAYLLSHSIRDAGFVGCAKLTDDFSYYLHDKNKQLNLANSLQGFSADHEHSMLSVIPETIQRQIKIGSDGVAVRKMHVNRASLVSAVTGSHEIIVSTKPLFEVGDKLLIANCLHGDVFQVAATTHGADYQTLISVTSLRYRYEMPAEIGQIIEEVFYIRDTGRLSKAGYPILALYRFDYRGIEEELIAGIENMRIYYGVLSEQGKIDYLPAAKIVQWQQVRMLYIELLLVSAEPYSAQANAFDFDHKHYIAHDNRLHQSWGFYVSLRER